ncbi:hypothetical protein M8J76_003832 [Diaphorina citri]|nr:hypothetical protein M8J76_003832 [Diaphorina citri]
MSKRTPQLVDRFVLKVISSQTALAAKLNTLTVTHMTSKYCKTKPTPPIVNSYCNISHQYGRELITYEKPIIYNYDYDIGKVSLQSETFNEYRKHPDSLQDAALSSEIQEKCPNAICIYTDASKKNEKVGAAWFCPTYKSKACFKLHPATSTYTAEVIGIWEALKYSASLKNNEILILTDSKSACQKLSKNCLNTTPTHLELEILSSYKHLQNTCKTVKLAWIKGHEGIKGNVEVDRLAKYATVHGEASSIKLCPSDVKCHLKKQSSEYLVNFLDTTNNKGLFYKNIFKDVTISPKPWFNDRIYSPRRFIVCMNRLRVNHALCKAYLNKVGIEPDNLCSLCRVREDIEHIVMECRNDKVFITLISLKNILIYQGARVMDGGHTMFMNKQYDSSNQEKHYNDDLINGGSETPVAISEPVETQGNLNKEIIKNIAVEKELSEIASAYNLHRNEGDSKTDELIGMDVDPPKDFKDVSESDKSVPSEHLSEGSELDSQDAPINQEDGKSNPKSSEEGVDENSQGTEEASQDSEAKSSKDLEDNSQDAEDNSKDEEDNSKDGEDNSKDGEDNSKDTEATSKDAGEESKDGEDSQDGENSEDVARNIKKEVDEDQDEGDEEEEDDDDDEENIVLSKKLKREVKIEESAQSENGDDSFQDGMCSICKEDLDTSDPPTINKHLSEKHVIVDDDDIKCGVCEKDYAERRGVVRHLLNAHLCYKPHRCDKCSKSFSRKDHLARHKRSHLPPVFECKFCDEDFTKQERLDKHLYKVHSDIFKSGQDDDVVELSGDDDSTVDVPSSDNDNDSDPAPSESGSSDSDSDYETQPRKRGRPPKRKSSRVVKTAAAKRPKRTPPPKRKQIKIQLKASKKSKKEMEADRKKEQEKRKREEEKRKKEAAARKRQKEKMWEEERALERLREREKLRKERAEREAAKEKLLKEELQKRIEEQ